MMLAALVLLAVWLRRAVGAPADALRSASGRLAGGDLETPVTLSVDNELGAVASDLETMRRRLAGNQIAGALEAALRLEEAERAAGEARAVFYAIADGVLLTDPFGRVTAMNRALEALTGWTEAEAMGRPYGEVLPIAIDKVGRSDDLVSRYGRKVPVAVSSAPSSTPAAGSWAAST